MEAEVIVLVFRCQELFPTIDMTSLLGSEVKMNVSIYEDNAVALVLVETLPPQFTPRSKHYTI